MTRAAVLLAALAGTAILVVAPGRAQTQNQRFRVGTDAVFVDVSVRDGGQPVTGLRAEDFLLTDNGVRQRIETADATSVPIDLTLVIDLSGNPGSPWQPRTSLQKVTAGVEAEVGEVAGLLRQGDRLRLLAIGTDVREVWPMREVASRSGVPVLDVDGKAALYDGLVAALMRSVEPGRRHVVIARTKGLDTMSSVDAQAVRSVTEQSDALFHLVAMGNQLTSESGLNAFQCMFMGYCWPTRRYWTPFRRHLIGLAPDGFIRLLPDGETIAAGAEASGGAFHRTAAFGVPTLSGAFKRAFDDFRSGYVLRYTPQGVAPSGWHAIAVKLAASRSYTVRARRGYFIEDDTPRPPTPPSSGKPATLADLVTAYDRGGYEDVVTAIRQASDPARLLRDFDQGGNPWPATPRREAAFALELAEPLLFSPRSATREAGHDLLLRFSRLVRHPLEPDAFERYWYFAALTQLEGSLRPSVTESFARRALERFPSEPRFALSIAIAIDQRWAAGGASKVVDTRGAPTPAHIGDVRAHYAAAIAFPETAVEARIRLAWFLHRAGLDVEALQYLTAAAKEQTPDAQLRYLRQLFAGHVLSSLGRSRDAIGAFQGAQKEAPAAQSPRVALMNALLLDGDRLGAEALAEQIQAESSPNFDPWWVYWQGQHRLHGLAMARLRELSQ